MRKHSDMSTILTFDVGGTSLRAGLYSKETRSLLSKLCMSTPNFLHSTLRGSALMLEVARAMRQAMLELIEHGHHECPSLAVAGMPGPVDGHGRVLQAPTILGEALVQPCPFKAELTNMLGLPVVVMNAITAAGFRYVEDGYRDFCLVSMGSGVGAKIFRDGQPVLGPSFDAGELGHVVCATGPDALPCDCGGHGHLGAYASGRGTERFVQAQVGRDAHGYGQSSLCGGKKQIGTAEIVKAFREGDAWTVLCIDASLRPLASSLATVRALAGIERYIVIGGFAAAMGPRYAAMLAAQCDAHYGWSGWGSAVELGHADDENGLLGCGRYAENRSTLCL